MKGWIKIFHVNGNQKKAGVAILISDKIDFKIKNIIRDQEGHYIMIKGSIQEEDNKCKCHQTVKRLSTTWQSWVWFPGQKGSLEKEMAIHSNTTAWKITWEEKPGRLQSMGSQRVGHDWATSLTHSLTRAPNVGAPQYIRQTLTGIRWEIYSNTIIVGDFNTPLPSMDKLSKQNQ